MTTIEFLCLMDPIDDNQRRRLARARLRAMGSQSRRRITEALASEEFHGQPFTSALERRWTAWARDEEYAEWQRRLVQAGRQSRHTLQAHVELLARLSPDEFAIFVTQALFDTPVIPEHNVDLRRTRLSERHFATKTRPRTHPP